MSPSNPPSPLPMAGPAAAPPPGGRRLPDWLKIRPPSGPQVARIRGLVDRLDLSTVCQEARCPNLYECWGGGTATFMVLGDTCTRGCRFCHVKTGNPRGWLDPDEPAKVAHAVKQLGLRYVVITSVDRDDLPDGGAAHFARVVEACKKASPGLLVEVLIPDFQADPDALRTVIAAGPEVIAQNLETVQRLTHPVRDAKAGYRQTLDVLRFIKQESPSTFTKSSLIVGLGETDDELVEAMKDLRAVGVDVLTLGQYLRPSARHLSVDRYLPPEGFQALQEKAEEMGFLYVAAGPLVRSSYKAGELFLEGIIKNGRHRPTPLPGDGTRTPGRADATASEVGST